MHPGAAWGKPAEERDTEDREGRVTNSLFLSPHPYPSPKGEGKVDGNLSRAHREWVHVKFPKPPF